jgi:proteic killer suppression protein
VSKPHSVRINKFAEKQLKRLPRYIKEAALAWVFAVESDGLQKVRRLPGYHDEPLKGDRQGQRSVRLNQAYRLIYEEHDGGHTVTVIVVEVNKHEY